MFHSDKIVKMVQHPIQKIVQPPTFCGGWLLSVSGQISEMIVNNPSDVKYRARLQRANKCHKRKGLFGE